MVAFGCDGALGLIVRKCGRLETVRLSRGAACAGDPSLRLKHGSVRDDAIHSHKFIQARP